MMQPAKPQRPLKRLRLPSHRFDDSSLDRQYVISNNKKAARQSAFGFALGTFGYAMYGLVSYFTIPGYFEKIQWFLIAFIVPSHIAATLLVNRMGKIYLFQWILVLANVFSAGCMFYLMWLAPTDYFNQFGYGLVLAVNMYFTILRMRFVFAVISSLAVLAGFYCLAWFVAAMPLNEFITVVAITLFINLCGLLATWFFESYGRNEFMQAKIIRDQQQELAEAKQKSEDLLMNILPDKVARRLLSGETTIADEYNSVSVLFADLEGFTGLSKRLTAPELVKLLNRIFTSFDEAAARHGLEKIKTIGDAYMAAAGLPDKAGDHARRCVAMAFEMLKILAEINRELTEDLRLRIGISSGPVVAGVIGRNKFIFDLWGETVNTASRMESSGLPGEIHVTENTAQELTGAEYNLVNRGEIQVKGIGAMQTYLVQAS